MIVIRKEPIKVLDELVQALCRSMSELSNFFLDLSKSVLEDGLAARLMLEVVAKRNLTG